MKKILVLLLIAASFKGLTQDITGKWYMISQSGIFEYHFTKDSVIVRYLFFDLSPKGQKASRAYQSTTAAGGKIVIATKDGNDTTKYLSTVFFDIKKNKTLKMAWNVKDTLTKDMTTLFDIHKTGKAKLFGYTFYHEKYIPHLKKLKSADEMTLEDFKKYIPVYTDKVQQTQQPFEEYNAKYSTREHYFQLVTQALFECGFNPLVTTETIDAVYEKYHNDAEVQVLLKKGAQKK